MGCGYDCEYSCEECDVPDKVIEFVNGYNKALEDLLAKVKDNHYLLSDKINSTDYGMFTCGIEQVVDELKR